MKIYLKYILTSGTRIDIYILYMLHLICFIFHNYKQSRIIVYYSIRIQVIHLHENGVDLALIFSSCCLSISKKKHNLLYELPSWCQMINFWFNLVMSFLKKKINKMVNSTAIACSRTNSSVSDVLLSWIGILRKYFEWNN